MKTSSTFSMGSSGTYTIEKKITWSSFQHPTRSPRKKIKLVEETPLLQLPYSSVPSTSVHTSGIFSSRRGRLNYTSLSRPCGPMTKHALNPAGTRGLVVLARGDSSTGWKCQESASKALLFPHVGAGPAVKRNAWPFSAGRSGNSSGRKSTWERIWAFWAAASWLVWVRLRHQLQKPSHSCLPGRYIKTYFLYSKISFYLLLK